MCIRFICCAYQPLPHTGPTSVRWLCVAVSVYTAIFMLCSFTFTPLLAVVDVSICIHLWGCWRQSSFAQTPEGQGALAYQTQWPRLRCLPYREQRPAPVAHQLMCICIVYVRTETARQVSTAAAVDYCMFRCVYSAASVYVYPNLWVPLPYVRFRMRLCLYTYVQTPVCMLQWVS